MVMTDTNRKDIRALEGMNIHMPSTSPEFLYREKRNVLQ